MSRHTITEATKLAGISRTQMYSHYIKKGLVKVSEANGKKYIDTSDLIAVFGELQEPDIFEQKNTNQNSTEDTESALIKELRSQITDLKKDKAELKEENALREERSQATIIALTSRLEAPEAPKRQNIIARFWHGLGEKDEN
jgi:hypothetical protein